MDGQDPQPLIEHNVLGPVGLAIDYPMARLYWADVKTHKIETVKLDGSDRQLVWDFSNGEIFYPPHLFTSQWIYPALCYLNEVPMLEKFPT